MTMMADGDGVVVVAVAHVAYDDIIELGQKSELTHTVTAPNRPTTPELL